MKGSAEGLLNRTNIKMKNPEEVMKKVKKMVSAGPKKLQIISDFDYTISRFEDKQGNRCWTTHAVFDHEAQKIDETLGQRLNALRDKYLPIEFDPDLTAEEKIPHMLQWWTTAHGMIVGAGFTKQIMQEFVNDSAAFLKLRDDCIEFLKLLRAEDVPLIVFSAGLGDLIEMVFQRDLDLVPPNVHIISNMMIFDKEGKVIGFKDPLIHTFNKNSSVVNQERAFFHKLTGRDQVLLMGDSLGDLHMDVGVENEGNVLKIGFLNFQVEKLLPQYLEGYDIVLVQEPSISIALDLVNSMLSPA